MDGSLLTAAFVALAGYLLGAIPFGLIFTRLAGGPDIRRIGSGNIGATNVLRTGHKGLALLTLIADAAKGAVAYWIGLQLAPQWAVLAGAAAFAGHLYPVWLGFKGGKGVATFLGLMAAISWPVGLASALTWLVVAILFRISSLSALVMAAFTPLYAYLWGPRGLPLLAFAMAVVIYWKHVDNIRRLLAGTEPRIGQRAGEDKPSANED
ncbi:MAG: glycerol-3-phosphate 1-O-acyltransferase [Alphaproteobacteria bacterium]|nr:MAG: glycerol-3-phosphate 1-O-acyltransferase [Alphaproteobacteria bacterium]